MTEHNNPDDDNLSRQNLTQHLADNEHRFGMRHKWMRNHDNITRLIGIIATAATIAIFGSVLFLAVFRQDKAVVNDKQLLRLARENHDALVRQECSTASTRAFPRLLLDPVELGKALDWAAECRALNHVSRPNIDLPPVPAGTNGP